MPVSSVYKHIRDMVSSVKYVIKIKLKKDSIICSLATFLSGWSKCITEHFQVFTNFWNNVYKLRLQLTCQIYKTSTICDNHCSELSETLYCLSTIYYYYIYFLYTGCAKKRKTF